MSKPGSPPCAAGERTAGPDARRVERERAEQPVDVVGDAERRAARMLVERRDQPVGRGGDDRVLRASVSHTGTGAAAQAQVRARSCRCRRAWARPPGGTTTTVNGSSTSAGPCDLDARRRARVPSYTGRVDEPVAEVRRAGARARRRRRRVERADLGEVLGLRGAAPGDEAHAAQQRLLVAEAEAALGLVLVVEPLGEVEQAGLVERGALGHRHAHVEVLARVAHLRVEADVDVAPRRARSARAPWRPPRASSCISVRTRPRSTCESGTTYARTRSTT